MVSLKWRKTNSKKKYIQVYEELQFFGGKYFKQTAYKRLESDKKI